MKLGKVLAMTEHKDKTLSERVEGAFSALKKTRTTYLEAKYDEEVARSVEIDAHLSELLEAPNERTYKTILMMIESNLDKERTARQKAEISLAQLEDEASKLRALIRLEVASALKEGGAIADAIGNV